MLPCTDMDAAMDYYAGAAGLRIDSVFPADAPRKVMLSAKGLRLTLERIQTDSPQPPADPAPIITKRQNGGFTKGRAGMQYRDLIPGRFGGRIIASHIRIPTGGPVPDYVHHHDVLFQIIFCVHGWVRVVYEDQGAPLLMEAGDCLLQPPHIRHRVLECSAELEVVELAGPAEHETLVDHDLTLPTRTLLPERNFGGQRFVFHKARDARWTAWECEGFSCRDTGVGSASDGNVSAVVAASSGAATAVSLKHAADLRFLFVLDGKATCRAGVDVQHELAKYDSCAIPANLDCSLTEVSPDFKVLDVSIPSRQAGQPVR